MPNKKLNNKMAISILRNHFSNRSLTMKGGATKNICKQSLDTSKCSIEGKDLKPNWCQMSTDLSCIYSETGQQNITPIIETISQKIHYNIPQKLSQLKEILSRTSPPELEALCKLLDIETNTTDTNPIIINKLIKNKIMAILDNRGWSFF